MMKFKRSTKKKLDEARSARSRGGGGGGDDGRSVSSRYSTNSTRSDYTDGNSYSVDNRGGGGSGRRRPRDSRHGGGGASVASSTGGSRRYSSAQSVASISSASVFAPSVVGGVSFSISISYFMLSQSLNRYILIN